MNTPRKPASDMKWFTQLPAEHHHKDQEAMNAPDAILSQDDADQATARRKP